eukprot:Skav211545  [mRNA]  locus=scaffold871:28356:28718:- [translate_table: standard]
MLDKGTLYVSDVLLPKVFACQLEFDDHGSLRCSSLAGEEKLRLPISGSDPAWQTLKRIARELDVSLQSLSVIMPSGQLLANVCQANPGVTIAELTQAAGPACPTSEKQRLKSSMEFARCT